MEEAKYSPDLRGHGHTYLIPVGKAEQWAIPKIKYPFSLSKSRCPRGMVQA